MSSCSGDRSTRPRRRTRLAALCLALLLLALGAGSAAAAPGLWTRVVQGIDYQSYVLPGPVRAYVARMDRSKSELILESGLAQGSVLGGTETVSQIARRYDRAVNAWGGTWGPTNQVWVAINGSFFDLETGEPFGGIIDSGRYDLRFQDLAGQSGFVYKQDRSVFIGGCVLHPEDKQRLVNLDSGEWISIDDINNLSSGSKLVLYSDAFGAFSPGGNNRIEVVVDMSRPAGIFPPPAYAAGVVREIRQGLGPAPIMFNQVVFSTGRRAGARLLEMFQPGDPVGISMELTHYESDCHASNPASWTKVYASVAGNVLLIADGELQETDNRGANLRNPRTAVCYNDDYIYFVVVDGRVDGFSIGMTAPELGAFCQDKLQATWGVNLDGGGSSTMWVNGIVQNHPSDGHERGVANALMMVQVQPARRSGEFSAGAAVRASEAANVLLGPGTNFRAIASVGEGAQGVVVAQPSGWNGLAAKGSSWWKVDFSGTTGWVDERMIELAPSNPRLESLQLLLEDLLGLD